MFDKTWQESLYNVFNFWGQNSIEIHQIKKNHNISNFI